MNYNDFYDEPSEFEQMIDEFKQSLVNSVKQEFKEEIHLLRKENAELQEFKREKQKIINEYENLKRSLHYEKETYERQIKQKRLNELLGEPLENAYGIKYEYTPLPKCDHCNDDRKLVYQNPLGETKTEQCVCDRNKKAIRVPTPLTVYKFTTEKKEKKVRYYFEKVGMSERDEYRGVSVVYNDMPFENIPTYNTVIIGKERAQAYCDWLNSKA